MAVGTRGKVGWDAHDRRRNGYSDKPVDAPEKATLPRSSLKAANQCGCQREQAERAAGCGDPITESLWPSEPDFPAGPFDLRQLQRFLAPANSVICLPN
jgi:hypothetical protein